MVEHMKKGAVMDVSIDTGGCFETSEWLRMKTYFIKAMYCIIVPKYSGSLF
jgi:alanine dehydrogenase